MTDADLQALLREAGERDDGPSWLRAAQALARSNRFEEAGRAAHRAGARGEDPLALLDGMAPALADLAQRELGERFVLGKLSLAAFAADGRHVHVALERQAVLTWDTVAGTSRTVASVKGQLNALAAGLEGEVVVSCTTVNEKHKQIEAVALVNDAGELSPPVGRGHGYVREVALPRPDLLLCAESKRARAYRRDGTDWPEKTVWSVNGESVALGAWGTAVVLDRDKDGKGELRLYPELAKAPRVSIGLDVPPILPNLHLRACGRRAVVILEDLVLLDGDGRLIARAPLPAGVRVYDAWPSPSGKLVAVNPAAGGERSTRLDVIDVTTGATRSFDLGARPRRPAWSLSGRKLAVPTDQGTVVLLAAPGGVEVEAPPPEEAPAKAKDVAIEEALFGGAGRNDAAVIDAIWGEGPRAAPARRPVATTVAEGQWVELRSPERFWRARRVGALIEFRHGKTGTKGSPGASPCADADEATRELEKRIREKERDGYRRV